MTLIFFLFVGLLFSACQPGDAQSEEKAFNIMAYYVPEKDYQPENLPLDQLTHIIFSFSNVIDGEMKFRHEEAGEKLRRLVDQKKNHPQLKVMLACGGWGAGGFSDMAVTAEGRTKFVQSTVRMIEEYQLDGIDMDWEYPALDYAGIDAREEDTQTFTLLMKELREEMDKLDRPMTLTFASAGWEYYYEKIELNEVMKYADYMNVMTYDQVTGTFPYTGHHTPLGLIKSEDWREYPIYNYYQKGDSIAQAQSRPALKPRSVKSIVNYCVNQGVAPSQIVIGSAFYGRAWKGVPPEKNGLYQPNQGTHIGWAAYHLIRDEYENKNGYTRYWDEVAEAPYLYSPTDSVFFSYDDTASVKLKTQYAIEADLGGVMFWELGNDTKEENSLLDAIYQTATNE
ncbi:glycoside hydrolase family 18 protein [Tunicatimonas pelagia]|uniref:glycoside hydrolase family 18 protein n=1 Tax=Tunicatimonas pelagia TaxID=931531 RepID=UPI0026667609|nr:glycoside hydrolase family 18 protein [Tunicatimonas pelagia]WKN40793.1 glycoside hydrolase family 18 protein [Tunicatimonas pelagia]